MAADQPRARLIPDGSRGGNIGPIWPRLKPRAGPRARRREAVTKSPISSTNEAGSPDRTNLLTSEGALSAKSEQFPDEVTGEIRDAARASAHFSARSSRLRVMRCTRSSGPCGRLQCDQGRTWPGGVDIACAHQMVEALKTKLPFGPG